MRFALAAFFTAFTCAWSTLFYCWVEYRQRRNRHQTIVALNALRRRVNRELDEIRILLGLDEQPVEEYQPEGEWRPHTHTIIGINDIQAAEPKACDYHRADADECVMCGTWPADPPTQPIVMPEPPATQPDNIAIQVQTALLQPTPAADWVEQQLAAIRANTAARRGETQ